MRNGLLAALVGLGLSGCNNTPVSPSLDAQGTKPGVKIAEIAAPPERALRAMPPLTGGTLVISDDATVAYASDPERDLIWAVDLRTHKVSGWAALEVGDQPGRLVLDSENRLHVVLRGSGKIADLKLDADGLKLIARRDVCEDPRGIGYQKSGDALVVACATGELASINAAGGSMTQRKFVESDLRDVIVRGDQLEVSRFRASEVLTLDSARAVVGRRVPEFGQPIPSPNLNGPFVPEVAYRIVAMPNGNTAVIHQRAFASTVFVPPTGETAQPGQPPAYGGAGFGGCEGATLVQSALTVMTPLGARSVRLITGSLPIDVAVSPDGSELAAVTGSPGAVSTILAANVFETQGFPGGCSTNEKTVTKEASPVAAAYARTGTLYVQTRAPAGLLNVATGTKVVFPVSERKDIGHALFHQRTAAALACASCHPEGHEDGRVWQFAPMGPRRTQALGGVLSETFPLHWDGALPNLQSLMNDVFVTRMGGQQPKQTEVLGLQTWLDALPVPKSKPVADATAVTRGQALFKDVNIGCATCHSGPRFTNNQTMDVGTGPRMQTPSLVGISARGPFLHNGCAKTLADRFGPCGGGDKHGLTSQLSAGQVGDLVAYLETL